MKDYEKSSTVCIFFCAETVKIVQLLLKKKCAAASEYIFLCWRPKEIPGRFSNDYVWWCTAPTWVPKQSFLISFSRYFDARDPMNYIVHQRCYEKSSHKACIFFCRNREDCVLKRKCAAASLYFVQKPCSWYFFILKQMCDCF